jgi:hypothetical protein
MPPDATNPATPTTPTDPAATPPAAATGTTHYPSFVDQPIPMDPKSWQDQSIPLWDLQFLGLNTTTGVNAILCKKLIGANRNLYNLCKKQQGIDAAVDLTLDQFGQWCWYGQAPVYDKPVQYAKAIQKHQSIKDKNSLHTSGSAIDVNLFYNPFIAGRTGGVCYGETHKIPESVMPKLADLNEDETASFNASIQKPEKGKKAPDLPKDVSSKIKAAKKAFWMKNKWQPGVEIYDRAMNLFEGKAAEVYTAVSSKTAMSKNTENPPVYAHYDRFARVSHALVHYFALVYGGNAKHSVPDRNAFADTFSGLVTSCKFPPGANDLQGGVLAASIVSSKQAVSDRFYDQIIEDHEMIKRIFVAGSLIVNDDLSISLPGGAQRDPCHGFLNIRPEVVTELVCEQQLRWGTCLFGGDIDADGDVMHFDLGHHFGMPLPFPTTIPKPPWPDELNEDIGRTT